MDLMGKCLSGLAQTKITRTGKMFLNSWIITILSVLISRVCATLSEDYAEAAEVVEYPVVRLAKDGFFYTNPSLDSTIHIARLLPWTRFSHGFGLEFTFKADSQIYAEPLLKFISAVSEEDEQDNSEVIECLDATEVPKMHRWPDGRVHLSICAMSGIAIELSSGLRRLAIGTPDTWLISAESFSISTFPFEWSHQTVSMWPRSANSVFKLLSFGENSRAWSPVDSVKTGFAYRMYWSHSQTHLLPSGDLIAVNMWIKTSLDNELIQVICNDRSSEDMITVGVDTHEKSIKLSMCRKSGIQLERQIPQTACRIYLEWEKADGHSVIFSSDEHPVNFQSRLTITIPSSLRYS